MVTGLSLPGYVSTASRSEDQVSLNVRSGGFVYSLCCVSICDKQVREFNISNKPTSSNFFDYGINT
jgi:hypothetical protein